MIRFQDKQLYIIILLVFITGCAFFYFFGRQELPKREGGQVFLQMDDFSEGWMIDKKSKTEVAFFPLSFDAKQGDSMEFYHRVPDNMTNENMYLLFETKKQAIQVRINESVIYESNARDNRLDAIHVVPIDPNNNNKNIYLKFDRSEKGGINVPTFKIGTKSQLMGEVIQDNYMTFLWGCVLIFISLCFLCIAFFVKNTSYAKKPLFYAGIEGCLIGVYELFQGNWFEVLTGWNYGMRILMFCIIIMGSMMHLLVFRCYSLQKKMHSGIDLGILLVLVYFISALVLHSFDLVPFATLVVIAMGIFALCVVVYTVIFGKNLIDNKRKENKPVFVANFILIVMMLIQLIMLVVGREMHSNDIFLPIGLSVYVFVLLGFGLKKALSLEVKTEKVTYNEETIRLEVLEQMNPNLLFASFHTLQNLIKSGSANSVKMIYYISVYFRNNLKALEKQGTTIPFSEEMEHILAYLQLQKTRNEQLKFVVECKVTDFKIPRHSIEPIVENAVKHGIGGKGNVGNVVVRTYQRSDGYAIQIIDDGIGFDKKQLKKKGATSLLQIMENLENICKAQIEIISHEGKGTVITIILPMLENDLIELTDEEEMIS